jgi:hypothetical protein
MLVDSTKIDTTDRDIEMNRHRQLFWLGRTAGRPDSVFLPSSDTWTGKHDDVYSLCR